MEGPDAIRGNLQQEIMRVLWDTDRATVEEVRERLPDENRGAYTTVQTVLNRLADRGLVVRHADSRAIRYAASSSEADHLSRSLRHALEGASEEARRSALANLVEDLEPSELEAVRAIAEHVRIRRP